MRRMTKERALAKLNELRDRISELESDNSGFHIDKSGEITVDDKKIHEFLQRQDNWRRDMKTAISYIFRNKPNVRYYLDKLKRLDFSLINYPKVVRQRTLHRCQTRNLGTREKGQR